MTLNIQANAHMQTCTGGICVYIQAYKCSYENKYPHSHSFKLESFALCVCVCVCVCQRICVCSIKAA